MFDINKRAAFLTVGDLRVLTNNLPAETRVCICGDVNCFYHEEQDGSAICLDCEDLQEYYDENAIFAAKRARGYEANDADNVLPFDKVEPYVTVKVVITDGIASSVLASKPVEVEFIGIDKDYEDYEALCQYEENLRNDETLREYDFTVAHFEENDK